MPRYLSTTAIVINKKSVKESDLLVTLLTPNLGKIVAIAKGIKNIKSSRLGTIQLGNLIKAQLYQKNDFLWLSESQTIVSFLQTDKSLAQLNLLFYFLEIINHFIAENQQIENVFDISCHLVDAIRSKPISKTKFYCFTPWVLVLRRILLNLLIKKTTGSVKNYSKTLLNPSSSTLSRAISYSDNLSYIISSWQLKKTKIPSKKLFLFVNVGELFFKIVKFTVGFRAFMTTGPSVHS
jgi:DNA repair protein RecO